MPVSVVVGGQFGSEGKGKVARWLAQVQDASVVVRVGGSNSGHTVIDAQGNPRVFRHLPTACLLTRPVLIIGPGSYIDVPVLLEEVRGVRLSESRLIIDPHAVVIADSHKKVERRWDLQNRIGSTGSGTGAAVISRARRHGDVDLAKSDPRLSALVGDTSRQLRDALERGERVIVEGTQGFGLSLLHSPDYPYVTSRDTSAAGFVSEAGLSPLDVDQVIMVIRAFPIRVAGNSGPLPNETTWGEITNRGTNKGYREYTTVTRKARRIARFDPKIVRAAITANNPTSIVLNHLDYVDPKCVNIGQHSIKVEHFIREVQKQIEFRIDFVGFGPNHIQSLATDSIQSFSTHESQG